MARAGSHTVTSHVNDRISGWHPWPLLVVLCALIAFANSFSGAFLFDDAVHILQNDRIRELTSIQKVLSGSRPVVDLSLAVNYAAHQLNVAGYHAVNLFVHILAGLVLYGIVRRTFLRCAARDTQHKAPATETARWVALTVALVWVVHPLQTQSVTYLIQRAESMMGLFYLLTLYCVIRGAESLDPATGANTTRRWYVAAVASCALGMGSKAVMVTAPLVVFLYDWTFLSRSAAQCWRRRGSLYAGLAGTWVVLWLVGIAPGVLSTTTQGANLGFAYKGIAPREYALTQFGVIVRYVQLSLWPRPLCLDYTWPVASTILAVVAPASALFFLVAAAAWGILRKSWVGFLGAWCFLILAPTSSFIPIKDAMFEHRMYLSLAAVIALLVVAGNGILGVVAQHRMWSNETRKAIAGAVVVVTLGVLGLGTSARNRDYRDAVTMWTDVTAKRPHNARAFEQLGTAQMMMANHDGAIRAYTSAVEIDDDFTSAHANLANILLQSGRPQEAVRHYREVLRLDPLHVEAAMNLGHALEALGRQDESLEAFRAATQIPPDKHNATVLARAFVNYGSAIGNRGDIAGATAAYRRAIRLWPEYDNGHYWLGVVLQRQGEMREAIDHFRKTLEINPKHSRARSALDGALRP